MPREQDEARAALVRGQKLLAQGDYNGSLKENQKVLSLSPGQPPADEAIFNMGLVYAHSENPKKDYRRSLGLFRRVINEFPQSQLVEQARAWVGVLQTNERLNQMIQKSQQVDIEIEQKKRAKEK